MISLHYVGLIRKNNVSARASLIHAPCWMWKRSRKRKRGKGEVYYLSPPPPLPSIYSCLSNPWLIRLIFRLRDTFTTGLCLVGIRQTGKKSFFLFNLHGSDSTRVRVFRLSISTDCEPSRSLIVSFSQYRPHVIFKRISLLLHDLYIHMHFQSICSLE